MLHSYPILNNPGTENIRGIKPRLETCQEPNIELSWAKVLNKDARIHFFHQPVLIFPTAIKNVLAFQTTELALAHVGCDVHGKLN